VPLESQGDFPQERALVPHVLVHQLLVTGQCVPLLHRLGPALVPRVGRPEAREFLRLPLRLRLGPAFSFWL